MAVIKAAQPALITGGELVSESSFNATKQAIRTTAGSVVLLKVDNTANAAASYIKLWNVAVAGVTVGTTVPDFIWKVKAGTTLILRCKGLAFGTAITGAVVTTGGTGGTTNPVSAVPVRVYTIT